MAAAKSKVLKQVQGLREAINELAFWGKRFFDSGVRGDEWTVGANQFRDLISEAKPEIDAWMATDYPPGQVATLRDAFNLMVARIGFREPESFATLRRLNEFSIGPLAAMEAELTNGKSTRQKGRTITGHKPDTSKNSGNSSRVRQSTLKMCEYLKSHVGKDGNVTDCVTAYCLKINGKVIPGKIAAMLRLANHHKARWQ